MMVNSIYTEEYSIGVEAEGHIMRQHISNGTFHHDGSVEVNGSRGECDYSCRDNCECYENCECDGCIKCSLCGEIISECCCDECSTCDICEERMGYCECIKAHSSMLSEVKCVYCNMKKFRTDHAVEESEMIACDECITTYESSHRDVDCADCGNVNYECDRDCRCECLCECDCSGSGGDDGEVVSNIIKEREIEQWFNDNKLAIDQTNQSCGIHVHVGNLTMVEYGILMAESFHLYLKSELLKWGKEMKIREGSQFFKRLGGGCTFARDAFRPEEQKMDLEKSSARYCFINYCWALHKTVEIRVLPSFQRHDLRSKAVKKVVEIIHSYINNSKPKIHSLEIKEVV